MAATWVAAAPGGCGPAEPAERASRPLTVAVAGRMEGFALSRTRSFYSALFAALVFEGLTRVDSAGQLRPALATRWDTLDGGRRFRFHLRRDVRFHSGAPFTAHDVVRAWQTALRIPGDAGQHAWMLDPIEGSAEVSAGGKPLLGARVVDDSTLDVHLTRPLTIFPQLISSAQAFVGAPESDDARPIGTGPWRWISGAAAADSIILGHHDMYWGAKPRMTRLVIRVVPDSQLVGAFASGAVDCTADVTRATMRALAARTDLRLIKVTPFGVVRMMLLVSKPPLNDIRVRRALAMALDRAQLARHVASGSVTVANGMLPPNVMGSDTSHSGVPYDPDGARRLLADAGFKRSRTLFVRLPEETPVEVSPDFFALLESYWRAIGVSVVRISGADAKADIDLHISYPDSRDPDDYLYARFHSSVAGIGGNLGHFRDSLVDRWLDSGRVVTDSAQRASLMRRTNARLDSVVANIFLWYVPVTTVSSTRINGCVAGMAYSTFVGTERAASSVLQ
jgi:ABC-type transport system substrate-binding protein